jgi:predicted nucleotidyltransferase
VKRERHPRESLESSSSGLDPSRLLECFQRPEVAAVYLFGSVAAGQAHALSDLDLVYEYLSSHLDDLDAYLAHIEKYLAA